MNVIQGCNCCEPPDCEIAADNFNRSFLNVGSPFVWAGNTGVFTISSGQLVCSTSDRYIVASGLADPVGGQVVSWVGGGTPALDNADLMVNWRDTSNYDFLRIGNNRLELWERIAGVNTQKFNLLCGGSNPTGTSSQPTIFRHGTVFAALVSNTSLGPILAYTDEMTTLSLSGITFGIRLVSGSLSADSVVYENYGSPCQEIAVECMACDYDVLKVSQAELIIAAPTGGANCGDMGDTYVVDFCGQRESSGTSKRCNFTGTFSGGRSVNIAASYNETTGLYGLEALCVNTAGNSSAVYSNTPSSTPITCGSGPHTLNFSSQTGAGACVWPSTLTVEFI